MLIWGILALVVGFFITITGGIIINDRAEGAGLMISIFGGLCTALGASLIFDAGKVVAVGETINSPQFRAGAVYEKLSEIKVDDDYLAILKDSKNNIAVYKSPKKLPDKFIASEMNDAVPIGGLVELGVESKERRRRKLPITNYQFW